MFISKKLILFLGGVAFGSAGFKLLSSKDAKKVYVHTTAAALRVKDCVMKTAFDIKENVEDIVAAAQDINAEREAKEQESIIDDEDDGVLKGQYEV